MNRVCITGNLTREPELRKTQGGMAILSFGIAVNDRRKNPQSGQWEDYANFIDCTMFGARAESLANYLAKGKKIAVDGKLRYSSWEDKQGNKRSKLEVIAEDIELLGSREDKPSGKSYGRGEPQQVQAEIIEPGIYDDDCPF